MVQLPEAEAANRMRVMHWLFSLQCAVHHDVALIMALLSCACISCSQGAVVLVCLCRYEFQCQYGSIGWAVGATLGYSVRCYPFLTHAHLMDVSSCMYT